MADISVHIFVQNLRDLLKSEHPMIAAEKNQLQALYDSVYHLGCFIKKTEEKCFVVGGDEKVSNLLTKIRKVVLEAENFVDFFLIDETSLDLKSVQKQIEEVKIEVDQMTMSASFDDETTIVVGDHGKKKNVENTTATKEISNDEDHLEASAFGIDETIDNILAGFDASADMKVIAVVGFPGIGKTTLAQKVFDHKRTRNSFQVRAWVTVSQTYTIRRLLIDILQSFSLYEDGDVDSTEDRLGENLLKRLKDKKYLIVLDDIWSIDAWNSIQKSFPNQHKGSKVLFTSRFAAIGKDLDINTHHMSGLSEEDSWNLLQNKVFGADQTRRCRNPKLEKFGREMARKCDGLPLAIVVIGGLLAKKDKTPEVWEQVATSLASAIATDREAYMDTLELSYHNLPLHLKACFLYLGSIFPEDNEVPCRKLVWLLVAEGFVIQASDGKIQSLEVIAQGYLNELVERSLVTVATKRSCGATKTLRIHDLLRDFCIVQGEQEKFLCKRPYLDEYSSSSSSSWESILTEQRRLIVMNAITYHFQDRQLTSHLRSFYCSIPIYCRDDCAPGLFSHNLRLLKVLHLDMVLCRCLHEIENLVHLRYFSGWGPSQIMNNNIVLSITKLLHLETFFLRCEGTFDLPDEVWNMVNLRHLYNKRGMFHFQASRSEGDNRSSMLGNLQTLHTLCACKSCLKMLVRTPALRKLGLSGNFTPPSRCSTVPDLRFLKQLETLKFIGSICDYRWSNALVKLQLPASLKKLTLQKTFLKWEEVSLLAELENLEVLKLLDDSSGFYTTADWDTSQVEFPKLKYLKLRVVNIQKWEDINPQFESLEVLVLEGCWRLQTIPFDLALSPSLHTIEVTRCNNTLEILAKDIEDEHENQCGNTDLRVFITS